MGSPVRTSDPLRGSGPADVEPDPAQPAAQIAAAALDVSPQRRLQRGCQILTRAQPVGPADVLVVDEELVETREGAHPGHPEEAGGWTGPQPGDEPAEFAAFDHCRRAALGQSRQGPGKDKPGGGEWIALAKQEVGGEIFGGPPVEQGRGVRAEAVEQIAQRRAFLGVERADSRDALGVDGAFDLRHRGVSAGRAQVSVRVLGGPDLIDLTPAVFGEQRSHVVGVEPEAP